MKKNVRKEEKKDVGEWRCQIRKEWRNVNGQWSWRLKAGKFVSGEPFAVICDVIG